jgi:hypothetical protein
MIPLGKLPIFGHDYGYAYGYANAYANTNTYTNTKGYASSLEYLMWRQV